VDEIAKMQWNANQKEKRFSLLKDQVSTLSRLGGIDDISDGLNNISGKWNGEKGTGAIFCRYRCC